MSDFPDDIMTTASWVAAHRLDLGNEAGQQIVRLIAHSLSDERAKSATRIAALEAENADIKERLFRFIEDNERMSSALASFERDNAALRSGEYLVCVIEERERLRKALEFYACTKERCDCVEGKERADDLTCGFVARVALEAKP